MSRVAVLSRLTDAGTDGAAADVSAYLRTCGLDVVAWPREADAVLVWADRALDAAEVDALLMRAGAGVPVLAVGAAAIALSGDAGFEEAAGIVAGRATPVHETRLRPGADAGDLTARVDGDVVVTDSWLQLDKVVDDVHTLLTSMVGLDEHAVMMWRPSSSIGFFTVGSRPQTLADPVWRLLVLRWLRHALGQRDGAPVRIGLLGYGAIGAEHAEAAGAVDGLTLAAVCDRERARLDAARLLAPDVAAYDDGDDLLASADVDLVIVSTPPNTHADWTLRALEAGKHVVVEKPFCLTTVEADEMVATAARLGRRLAVYQNRRWDADYLALKRIVSGGAIGDVFHYESFVGSYGHPCNYWHSDEEVSGGAIYDWGSHFLDWALDLLPQPVTHVTAATHKRRWHDVTNADHSRVTVRFADDVEAEFVHSDLAAAMKPKWYVLGTEGAIVGQWRQERVVSRNTVGNLVEDRLNAAESPADLSLHAGNGSITQLAIPPAPRHPFHRELAESLLSGAPMSVTPEGSRRNISVMEAASISAREGGRPVIPS